MTDGLRDAFAGVSVAVRIVCARHGLLCLRIVQESVAFGDDTFPPGPHQSGGAGENGFGPFGLIAHHQHRLPERRRFFLDPPGIDQRPAKTNLKSARSFEH